MLVTTPLPTPWLAEKEAGNGSRKPQGVGVGVDGRAMMAFRRIEVGWKEDMCRVRVP